MSRYFVFPSRGKWCVQRKGAKRASSIEDFRGSAIAVAKSLAGPKGEVSVHNAAGLVTLRIPKRPTPEKVAASVHIYDAPAMTKAGRKEIAGWLRKHADWLLKEGDNYAKRFRGRYMYPA
jgi:hypothetical protein